MNIYEAQVVEMKLEKGIQSTIVFLKSMKENASNVSRNDLKILIQNGMDYHSPERVTEAQWNEAINSVTLQLGFFLSEEPKSKMREKLERNKKHLLIVR